MTSSTQGWVSSSVVSTRRCKALGPIPSTGMCMHTHVHTRYTCTHMFTHVTRAHTCSHMLHMHTHVHTWHTCSHTLHCTHMFTHVTRVHTQLRLCTHRVTTCERLCSLPVLPYASPAAFLLSCCPMCSSAPQPPWRVSSCPGFPSTGLALAAGTLGGQMGTRAVPFCVHRAPVMFTPDSGRRQVRGLI